MAINYNAFAVDLRTMDRRLGFNMFGVSSDETLPTVTLVSPSAGSTIAKTAQIVVDVTDDKGLALVAVYADYIPYGITPELVHDGFSFTALFGSSTRADITGGYRYTISRVGGWKASPTIKVYAVDRAGNKVS